jgi:hypothetical protein
VPPAFWCRLDLRLRITGIDLKGGSTTLSVASTTGRRAHGQATDRGDRRSRRGPACDTTPGHRR